MNMINTTKAELEASSVQEELDKSSVMSPIGFLQSDFRSLFFLILRSTMLQKGRMRRAVIVQVQLAILACLAKLIP